MRQCAAASQASLQMTIRILLADDHGIVREGLKQLFMLSTDFVVAGEATTGAEVLDAVRAGSIDLILLDMTMPGICGVELIHRLRLHPRCPPIMVLTMHSELQIARRAIGAGAAGYLTKDSDPKTLMAAIRRVASGGRFLDPQLAEKMLFDSELENDRPPHEQLSDREFDIMRRLVTGMGINEIAGELSISNKTVSTHKARLMQKMGFTSNADMIRYAVRYGLVE